MIDASAVRAELSTISAFRAKGRVISVLGPVIKASLNGAAIGDWVAIERGSRCTTSQREDCARALTAEVVGFVENNCVISPFGDTLGIIPGARVESYVSNNDIELGDVLLGTIVDCLGKVRHRYHNPQAPAAPIVEPRTVERLDPLTRMPISEQFITGVRAIDGLVPLGIGQRVSVFSGPGVGKSTLLRMIARGSAADVNVLALIGERGKEVKDLLEHIADSDAIYRTVVVVSTSDEPAICRAHAANTAMRIAEHFRDANLNVLLQIDSLTRLLRAYREVGLCAGEVPVRRGYPPSVFEKLPRLIERAGNTKAGSITAIYTVLCTEEADVDPMNEEIMGLTDGHIMLTRENASEGIYPAIDVRYSVSRAEKSITAPHAFKAASAVRKLVSEVRRSRDLLELGQAGLAEQDNRESQIAAYLTQKTDDVVSLEQTRRNLYALEKQARASV